MIQFVRTHWRILNIAIKIVLVVAFGWFVSKRLTEQGDLTVIWQSFVENLASGPVWMLWLAVVLMPFNWLMETLKWKTLMRPADLPMRRAIAGILSGVTLSLFTPNRTGEYGGRILYVRPGDRWRAVLASVTGSIAQNMVYVTLGLVAGVVFLSETANLPPLTIRGIWILVPLIICGLGLIYFQLPVIAEFVSRRKAPRFLHRPWDALQHLVQMPRQRLTEALGFSAVRYGIFSFQYVLLLQFFGVELPWLWLIGGVAVIYLVQTSIPLPPLLDLVARNEVGIVLWVGMGANELSIVAAGLTIWILNLAFPALFGLFTIGAVNVPRTFGYEKTYQSANPVEPVSGLLDGSAQRA